MPVNDSMLKDDDLKNLFSKKLKKIMDTTNINQIELSKVLGVSESTVGKWLLKKAMPRMGIIQKLADHFNVGKSYFLEETANNSSSEPILTKRDNKNINKMLESMRDRLKTETGLMFDGMPASDEAVQSILDAMEVGLQIAKKRNKIKYNPTKNKRG